MKVTPNVSSPDYWNSRYAAGETGWDMGMPTPAFVDLLESRRLQPGKTLVLGCGRGHDAVVFAQHGFDVTAIDFSEEAITCARRLAHENGVTIDFVQEDVFDFSLGVSDEFDYIVEYGTYCAIEPSRRPEFASAVASMLKDGGECIALFFPLDGHPGSVPDRRSSGESSTEGVAGPPFPVSMDEVHRLFGKKLELISVEASARSVTSRKGRELMTVWRRAS